MGPRRAGSKPGNSVPQCGVHRVMLRPLALSLTLGALLTTWTALANPGVAESQSGTGTAAAKPKATVPAPPPTPAIPPPVASHLDPTAPVPTNPPEQIAPPATLGTGSAGSHTAGSSAK
jgi:hypothetical protein